VAAPLAAGTARIAVLNVALFGPPGSGKGTQAELLCQRFGFLHLSTGELLRAERREATDLGKQVDAMMRRGQLVPDEIVGEIVRKEVQRASGQGCGVLFDGYPRTLAQFERLEEMLRVLETRIHCHISLDISDEKVIGRLTSRRTCTDCGKVYNLIWHKPRKQDTCDSCSGELYQRSDDRPEAITRRLREYHDQTQPILDELSARGTLRHVSAERSVGEIQEELVDLLEDCDEMIRQD
jgi:adenylate kinase